MRSRSSILWSHSPQLLEVILMLMSSPDMFHWPDCQGSLQTVSSLKCTKENFTKYSLNLSYTPARKELESTAELYLWYCWPHVMNIQYYEHLFTLTRPCPIVYSWDEYIFNIEHEYIYNYKGISFRPYWFMYFIDPRYNSGSPLTVQELVLSWKIHLSSGLGNLKTPMSGSGLIWPLILCLHTPSTSKWTILICTADYNTPDHAAKLRGLMMNGIELSPMMAPRYCGTLEARPPLDTSVCWLTPTLLSSILLPWPTLRSGSRSSVVAPCKNRWH